MAHIVTEHVYKPVGTGRYKMVQLVARAGERLSDARARELGLVSDDHEPAEAPGADVAAEQPAGEAEADAAPEAAAEPAPEPADDGLDDRKVAELRELADEAGVAHSGLRKAELVAALREARDDA